MPIDLVIQDLGFRNNNQDTRTKETSNLKIQILRTEPPQFRQIKKLKRRRRTYLEPGTNKKKFPLEMNNQKKGQSNDPSRG